MIENAQMHIQAIIARIMSGLVDKVDLSSEETLFVQNLFTHGNAEDLAQYDPEDLSQMASTIWKRLESRHAHTHQIRISNPDIKARSEYGAPTALTAIEIINDDMPFLFDSIMGELNGRGLNIRMVLHPIFTTTRDSKGLRAKNDSGNPLRESVILIHVDQIRSEAERAALTDALDAVLKAVRVTVSDWHAMIDRIRDAIKTFRTTPPPLPPERITETIHFLEWLINDNFTLIGTRQYRFDGTSKEKKQTLIPESSLGILRDPSVKVLRRGQKLVTITPELSEFLAQPAPLIITKANTRSLVHRRAHLDYIGLKLFSKDGELESELRIIGLFTSTAYTKSARVIPYLKHKVDTVLQQTGFEPSTHFGKTLIDVLETYPRDELFQIDQQLLTEFALTIMQLHEHPRLRVLVRIDKFDRFASIIVFVPRDCFSTDTSKKIGDYLARSYDGRVSAVHPAFLTGVLVRVHYIIGRSDEGRAPLIQTHQLETDIIELIRGWKDKLLAALAYSTETQPAHHLQQKYANAFSPAYQDLFDASTALDDIRIIEHLNDKERLAVAFMDCADENGNRVSFKLYSLGSPIALSDRVPILENMGFRVIDERSYFVHPEKSATVYLHDMTLTSQNMKGDLARIEPLLANCFKAVWHGDAEDDGYNGLTLRAELHWYDVTVLRAYSRYLRQILVPYSQDYMWATLNKHATIATDLVALFRARFDPDIELVNETRKERVSTIVERIEAALQNVDILDEDTIIHHFMNLIMATMRCNVFQNISDKGAKSAIAFKIASQQVDATPEPRPFMEIWVYAPRVEGVHLRFGKVARGGLRWSDRPQDFRTEVLGLVKAQQVKNAVIVPVGAKGGFVAKHLPVNGSRDDIQAEAIAAYKIFISSLLDVTDNLHGTELIHPDRVMRYDDNDPYLVVAADKGTATFSDIANTISQTRQFWLDDAFASGGSAGYDHKKMGITARGAWEAVKRHFREMDIDIQTTPFTVIGIGDMSGDVFGNGMLLSRKIRLCAAFDHRHIFIDPDPDPETSFTERQRLFNLPRSSWTDYDERLISDGGGVFSRSEKAISLSPQIRSMTGLKEEIITPLALIRTLLKTQADLLWFGGIGTYIRANDESDDQVGDRANDAIRIKARDLRVKVIGEGANLGMTQRARIAFAQKGGRLNTDAIDNSAGVNSSDLEVNIKIALGKEVREGKLSIENRNSLLAEMTEAVSTLVLNNNVTQTLSLSLTEKRGLKDLWLQARFMKDLEQKGLLDRTLETLPDDAALLEREKNASPLTRPELAVLMAYAKITLFNQLIASDVPDDPYLSKELMNYFPGQLQERYPDAIAAHRLRREIIATKLANSMINRGGATITMRMTDQAGSDIGRIAKAFAAVNASFRMNDLNSSIDRLDNKIQGSVQLDLYLQLQDLLIEQMTWFLRHESFSSGLADMTTRYANGIATMFETLNDALPDREKKNLSNKHAQLIEQGVPNELAAHFATMNILSMTPDIILVSEAIQRDIREVAQTFFAVRDHLNIDRLSSMASDLPASNHFERLALNGALENLADAQRQITMKIMSSGKSGMDALTQWIQSRVNETEHTRKELEEIIKGGTLTLSKLMVAASLLHDLTQH